MGHKEHRQNQIKESILKHSKKIIALSNLILRFGPKRGRGGQNIPRSGMIKHWHKMAKFSLIATRKKIYRLEEQLKALK